MEPPRQAAIELHHPDARRRPRAPPIPAPPRRRRPSTAARAAACFRSARFRSRLARRRASISSRRRASPPASRASPGAARAAPDERLARMQPFVLHELATRSAIICCARSSAESSSSRVEHRTELEAEPALVGRALDVLEADADDPRGGPARAAARPPRPPDAAAAAADRRRRAASRDRPAGRRSIHGRF